PVVRIARDGKADEVVGPAAENVVRSPLAPGSAEERWIDFRTVIRHETQFPALLEDARRIARVLLHGAHRRGLAFSPFRQLACEEMENGKQNRPCEGCHGSTA